VGRVIVYYYSPCRLEGLVSRNARVVWLHYSSSMSALRSNDAVMGRSCMVAEMRELCSSRTHSTGLFALRSDRLLAC
jgi:hypothetical protein